MKKISILFAIIIATLSFTACSNSDSDYYASAPAEMTVDGPGITIPGDSVYFQYQYPKLGRWLDCNLKNRGMKKLLGWATRGVWVPVPSKFISDDELENTYQYSYTGNDGVVVDKKTLGNYAKVTVTNDGSVVTETATADPAVIPSETKSFRPRDTSNDDHSLSIFGLGWLPSLLLIILLLLLIALAIKKLFFNNGTSNADGAGHANNRQTVVNNAGTTGTGNASVVVNPDSTITINTSNTVAVVDPNSTIRIDRK